MTLSPLTSMTLYRTFVAVLLAAPSLLAAGAPVRKHAPAPAARHASATPSGAAILKLTQEYVDVAPRRFIGSPGHAAAEQFLRDHFKLEAAKGNLIADSFIARTPVGQMAMTNYIVKFPSEGPAKRDGVIVLASHYETNYPLKDIDFVGANDGACTTALLIALGQYMRVHPPTGYSVWLLFDDGEEAIGKDGMQGSDQLYGVRHIAAKWSGDGTLAHIKALIVADMLGWKQMNIDKELNSTPWLLDLLGKAAKDTGHAGAVFRNATNIDDDHIPFKERGVPVLDVICYEYGPFEPSRNPPDYAFHHTALDSMDKLSAQSLQISADIFLDLLKLIDQR